MGKIIPREQRTPQQVANHNRYALESIHKVFNAVPVMQNFSFFNPDLFIESGEDETIQSVCLKYDVDETHIRTIGGWQKEPT